MGQCPSGRHAALTSAPPLLAGSREPHAEPASVLVIEDDPGIGEMLGIVLTAHGLRPHWIGHGAPAPATAARLRPQLVLLDLMLPDVDGFTVCRNLRRTWNAPIVVISAARDPELIEEALACGADDYLPKPFSTRELVARIDVHVRTPETP